MDQPLVQTTSETVGIRVWGPVALRPPAPAPMVGQWLEEALTSIFRTRWSVSVPEAASGADVRLEMWTKSPKETWGSVGRRLPLPTFLRPRLRVMHSVLTEFSVTVHLKMEPGGVEPPCQDVLNAASTRVVHP